MKLAYITHQYFPRHIGGTEMLTRSLVRRAIAAGHEVVVLTCVESDAHGRELLSSNQFEFEGAQVVEVEFNLSLMDRPLRAEYDNAYMAEILTNLLGKHAPDVVHISHALRWSASALSVCDQLHIPTVVTLSDFWFLCPRATLIDFKDRICSGPDRLLKCVSCVTELHRQPITVPNVIAIEQRPKAMEQLLAKATRVIALSNFQKELFIKNGFDGSRIEVLQHGLEIDGMAASISDEATNTKTIGFIGSLVKPKGLHVLIEALRRIPDADLQLRIYGPINGEDKYTSVLLEQSKKDSRIQFLGAADPSELGKIISQFDALAVPAIWFENEPLVVKSALYLGIPMLISDIGSLPEMIENGRTGALVKPGCVKSWADAIESFVRDPMPKYAPPPVKTMDESAAEFLRIYSEISIKDKQYATSSH